MPTTFPTPTTLLPGHGAGWRLRLLGLPMLERAAPLARLNLSAKDAALLAVVAIDGPLAAEHVAALLWPATDHHKADANLRQRLYRLRREAGTPLVGSSGAQLQLAAGLRTDLALSSLDDDGEDIAADELLGDLDFDTLPELAQWLREARRGWHTQRDAALAAAAARCEARGAIARGLLLAQRLSDSEPLSEHAQRRLMRLHYLRGDCSAAIAGFERFEQRLKDELGARPSAETIELLATIERGAAALPARRATVPASLLRPPRLVGRQAEAAALARAWAGERAFALIGEAGIGKTRLLHDFCAGQPGIVVAQARPGDAGIAYALLARLLRAVLAAHPVNLQDERRRELALVVPELGSAIGLAGEAQRLLLLRAVEATLAAAAVATPQGLQAVVVDDLHFADDASVEFMQSLTQADGLSALRWGFAQRPAEGGGAAATLCAALAEGQHLETVAIGPLDLAQMGLLIESLALPGIDATQLAPALLKHAGGNPMFALETLKDMVLGGWSADSDGRLPQPTTVGALVERRLAQLSPAALKLARTAALAADNFSAELAATVLGLHPLDVAEPWRELEAAQVIRGDAFAHDLIFEAARASVPGPIAQLLHQRIAEYLLARGAAPARTALHWAGALAWPKAGEAYAAAARLARRASQRGHEINHWQHARECFERGGDSQAAFDARCEAVAALIVVQGVAQADRAIDALLLDARTERQRLAALIARANAALMAADHRRGVAAAVEAGALAERLGATALRVEAARLHAVGLAQAGSAVQGLAVIEPCREWVEREGSVEQQGRYWSDCAYVLNSARRLRETGQALARAIEHTRALGDLAELATLTSNLATVKGNLGHAEEALQLAQQALAIQTQLGTTEGPGGGVVETYVALYAGMFGRYGPALELLDAAIARFARDAQATWVAVASHHKVHLLLQLGQFARARQTMGYEAPPVEWVRARGAMLSARIERASGQAGPSAASALQQALVVLRGGGDVHVLMHAELDEAECLAPAEAAARCSDVQRRAEALELAAVSMRAALLHAQALHRGGRSHDAAALLRACLPRLAQTLPADMYLPDAWWLALQVFEAEHADADAAMALAQGTRWVLQVALPQVPEPFRESFLQRNPTNVRLLAAAGRRAAA